MYTIYRITNRIDGKFYIGVSVGNIPWNKGNKGNIPWNKGLKGAQRPWNKNVKIGPEAALKAWQTKYRQGMTHENA